MFTGKSYKESREEKRQRRQPGTIPDLAYLHWEKTGQAPAGPYSVCCLNISRCTFFNQTHLNLRLFQNTFCRPCTCLANFWTFVQCIQFTWVLKFCCTVNSQKSGQSPAKANRPDFWGARICEVLMWSRCLKNQLLHKISTFFLGIHS